MAVSSPSLVREAAASRSVRRRRTPKAPQVVAYVLLSLGALLMVFPFVWLLLSSF